MRPQPLIAMADVEASSRWYEELKHREIWLRDPDGYVVVLAGAYGDV